MNFLKTNFAGLNLENPIMTASGCFGFGLEYKDYFDPNELGAILIKGLTPEPRDGNYGIRIAETPAGMLNSVGLENPGIDYFEKLAKNNNELKLDSVESAKEIIKEESDVLKKDIAFHFFLPHMESVKNKLSENSLEEILYKFKAELPSEEFIKILDAFKSCGEKI